MKEQFDYLIKKYNKLLNAFPDNPNEVYKWEAIQHFQENWNENAVDFYTMFNEAFKKKANLVYQNSFGFLDKLGKTYPDKLKHLFQLIFENPEADFYDILEKGKNYADDLISDLKEKLGKDVLNHQFDERTLSFLLFLRYPEKNTLFKADVYEYLCSFLEVSQEEKKYNHFITMLTQLSVQAENSISLEQRNKFVPTGFDYPLLLAQDIVWQALISVPKNNFQKAFNSLPQQNLRVYYDFLDTIINELSLGNTYNQVFSVTNDVLKYHIGKRICLALDKSGFVFITNNQTVLNKKREDFTNPGNAFLYYNCTINDLLSNKENIINAIREEIELDRETYRKNYDNAFFRKSVFNKKYRTKLLDGIELITFSSLDQLVKRINSDLGNFCRIFQTKRKELFEKKKMNSANQLFVYNDNSRDWAINEGGGTELQYHLYFRDNEIGYGLGFNAQYVPFANEYTPQDYMKPFALSYLNQPKVQSDLQTNGFKFIYGSQERLANLQLNDYILIGKTKDCIWNEETNAYEFSSYSYNEMLEELKGIIFRNYITIIEQRNTFTSYNPMMEKNTELLKYKKQIILQGPPGTGKTKLAKEIAEEFIKSNTINSKTIVTKQLTKDFIKSTLKINQKIESKSKIPFEVVSLDDNVVILKSDVSQPWRPSYNKIIESFQGKLWEIKGRTGGFKPYEDAVAKYFYDNHLNSIHEVEKNIENTNDYICLVQFHPSYTYEDFVRGIVAKTNEESDGIIYLAENKTLGILAENALNDYDNKYVLIIDEINRANLSSVLGELIYALEYRGEAVESMYAVDDDNQLILPPNLYIIGTMNTADRSVGHIDYAIRRRFAFVDVLPENLKEKQGLVNFHEALFLAVEKLFNEHTSPEFEVKDVQLGHSYFIDKSNEENGVGMDIRLEYEIKPILLEYVKDGVLIGKGKDIKKEIEDLKTLL